MPRVAEYEADQALTEVVSQPRATTGAGDAVFESNIRVIEGAGRIGVAFAEMKQKIDETSAEEALVQFERDKNELFFNAENGYFNTQGRNAFDNSESAVKALDDLKKKYGESLSSRAKFMFDKAADVHVTKGRLDINRHAAKGFNAWEIATSEAAVENTLENASLYWNQPDQLKVQKALGEQHVLDSASRAGIGPEATAEKLQTFRSSFAKNSVEAAISSSGADGEEALQRFSDELEGPQKVILENKLKAKKESEKTKLDAQQAVLIGTRMSETYDSREAIRDEVNKIEDPELRKKAMAESMRQFELKKKAESEARSKSFEDAESHVLNGGSAETFKAEDPEGWARLSTKQKRSIESGKSVVTDWNAYSEVMTLPKSELAKVDPADYFDRLAPAERSKLVAAVKSANGTGSSKDKIDHQVGRTRTSQMTSAVEQILGRKSKWDNTDRAKADTFYSLVDEELTFRESQEGRLLSSEEFTKLLSDMTRKVTIERSFLTFDILAPDEELSVTDLPPEDVSVLSKHLRDNGIPVTADNLVKAQRQASQ